MRPIERAALIGLALYFLTRGAMELKAGVVLALTPEMAGALHVIEAVHRRLVGRGAIITSGRDGVHKADSKHYGGNAVDLRTRDLTPTQRGQLAAELAAELGAGYDVVDEGDHVHVEYDPS